MIAVSLNVGGGVRLIKPAKLYMCTQKHYKHNEDGRTAPGVCGNGSVPLSHSGNVVTRIGIHTHTHIVTSSSPLHLETYYNTLFHLMFFFFLRFFGLPLGAEHISVVMEHSNYFWCGIPYSRYFALLKVPPLSLGTFAHLIQAII